jgi:hypothetical protein
VEVVVANLRKLLGTAEGHPNGVRTAVSFFVYL